MNKYYCTTTENGLETRESYNVSLNNQNKNLISKQDPKNLNNDEIFYKDMELSALINFIENLSDISSTINCNKSDQFLNEELNIYLKEIIDESSKVTKCYNYKNLLVYLNNTNDIIYDIIIALTKNEVKCVKPLTESIRRVTLELDIIDKLLPEVEKLFEAKKEKENLTELHYIKDGIFDLKNNMVTLRSYFEPYRLNRIKDYEKEYDLQIQLLKDLQKHLKTVRNLLYPLSEAEVQKRIEIFLYGLISTVSEISNTISRYYEKNMMILKFDFNILEDIWIGVRKYVDRLISYKRNLTKN
jgi:hypothetical protein